MGNALFSSNYKAFLRGIGKNELTITDIIDYTQESMGLIAEELHIGRLESSIVARPNSLERVGYNGQDVLYSSGKGYDMDVISMDFKTGGDVEITMMAYPEKGYKWSEEEKNDLHFICANFFALFERSRMGAILKNAAYTESMTGALNIEGMMKYSSKLASQGVLQNYVVAFFNIKNFKYLNGRYGAKVGNLILKSLVDTIYGFVIPGELIARLGGDNFAALIRKDRVDGFVQVLSPLNYCNNIYGHNVKIDVTFRIGLYQIQLDEELGSAISKASTALGDARRDGSADVVWFDENMQNRDMNAKKAAYMFGKALENKEFLVYYQPKVRLEDNTLCGCEALVRWQRGDRLVLPMSFIPALEKDGSICELDMYVFDKVCSDLRTWIDSGIEPVRISSNFSKYHINNDDFARNILEIMNKYSIDPKYIEIELTESACYEDAEKLSVFLKTMNSKNIHVSIDDFGTGYSSLGLIKDLPNVHVIKLDQSFVRSIDAEDEEMVRKDKVVIKNVINMIDELEIGVIAEGVETDEERDFLRDSNCEMAQGYLYDKPMSHDDFDMILRGDRKYNK